MAQKLRVLLVLPEFHSWTPSPISGGLKLPVTLIPGDPIPLSGLYGYPLTHIHTYTQTQIKNKVAFKNKDVISLGAYSNDCRNKSIHKYTTLSWREHRAPGTFLCYAEVPIIMHLFTQEL